jgi:hypothetical protein
MPEGKREIAGRQTAAELRVVELQSEAEVREARRRLAELRRSEPVCGQVSLLRFLPITGGGFTQRQS